MNTTPCKPGTHTITVPSDPAIRAVRCTVCNQPVALYAPAYCFCGQPASFYSTPYGGH
jgi:hypothetical protein